MELGVPFGSIQGIELSTALDKRLGLKLGMGLFDTYSMNDNYCVIITEKIKIISSKPPWFGVCDI